MTVWKSEDVGESGMNVVQWIEAIQICQLSSSYLECCWYAIDADFASIFDEGSAALAVVWSRCIVMQMIFDWALLVVALRLIHTGCASLLTRALPAVTIRPDLSVLSIKEPVGVA